MSWNLNNILGLDVITVDSWNAQGIVAAFSTRRGGISARPFDTLNLGLHVGDAQDVVLSNRESYVNIFALHLDMLVCCEQVHGSEVIRVSQADRGRGARMHSQALPGADAMISDTPGLFMMALYADCIPVYFFDPRKRAVGLAHSGWKGTMAQIAVNTIRAMHDEFGSMPEDMNLFIGPGIGSCCFAIQADLAERVRRDFRHLSDILYTDGDGGCKWDLKETNRQLLVNCGVKAENITVCDLCTACNPQLFYSYRRDKGRTGRMGALLGIRG